MKVLNILLLALLMSICASPLAAQELVDARQLKAKKIADEIIDMRSERAALLIHADKAVTPKLFKEVCGAVKKRAMALARENKVKIRHAA
ncbi:MAG: hypothetical protein IMF07_04810, partial [Proteobacteria bacterium]|nr:hypothetical protein [Pseudomonadota bacterium]